MFWRSPEFGSDDVEILAERTVFKGFYRMVKYRLRYRQFGGRWSPPVERELFERGASVAVLALDPRRQLVGLIEQFRIGALREENGPWLLEVVAGMVGETELPEQVATRELQEEAGVEAIELKPICSYLSSPGGSNEKLHLYLALVDLDGVEPGIHGVDEEQEDIYLHILTVKEAFAALRDGRCRDAATTICLQWLQLNARSLDAG